ncbi:MAG: glycoside hydrolase family 3 N-terminal domain-containing protein [Bacteroidota bacterium]
MATCILAVAESCKDGNAQVSLLNSKQAEIDQKVKVLLSQMSIADKAGEMTQLAIDMISVGTPYKLAEPHQIDEKKLKEVIVHQKVGSILNCGGHGYSREHWHEIISAIQQMAVHEKESGIPVLYGIDAIHGTNYTQKATLYPQQIALAATWNPELVKDLGKITAYETRASGIPWNFSPVLDVGRDPRWSRLWEGFGEDVHLCSTMGVALVNGYQGNDIGNPFQVAACMKHFLGYSMPITGKDRTQAWIPERQLREYFLPPFRAAIEAGAATIMINSGEMNGIPVHANPRILIDLLRKDLCFEGIVVSDWEDIRFLYTRHKVAKDYKEAIKIAINAGVDLGMVPVDLEHTRLLRELIESGEIPMARVDEAVGRILKLKFQLALFDHPIHPMEKYPEFASSASQMKSYQAAVECLTLLKNERNVLPLAKTQKVLVTGPTAHSLNYLNGGWTNTWQGDDPEYNTPDKLTLLEAIQEKIGENQVLYSEGTTYDQAIDIADAVRKAKMTGIAIVCLGERTYTEKPGDIDDMDLPVVQGQLVEAIAATGTPIVLVLVEGRPRGLAKFEAQTAAVLLAYLPGNEGGKAIASVLFGDENPSGKLPYTYPRFSNSMLTYDHKGTDLIKQDFSKNAFNPQWEFGFGMSYTDFHYSKLEVNQEVFGMEEPIKISVTVENKGERVGKEVVQLYVSDLVASVTPSVKRLRDFKKIELLPRESKKVAFELKAHDLAFVGIDNQWLSESGAFVVQIDNLKASFRLESLE